MKRRLVKASSHGYGRRAPREVGGAQQAVPSGLHTIAPLHLPPEVYQYVTSKVRADLPALTTPEQGVGGLVGAALLRTLGLARAAAGVEEGEDKRGGTKQGTQDNTQNVHQKAAFVNYVNKW